MTGVGKYTSRIHGARRRLVAAPLVAGMALLPLIATRVAAQTTLPTYTVLYTFTGGADGGSPAADLVRDAAGNLYGTTILGGNASSSCPNGSCGVVFKLGPSGNQAVLYSFTGGADGGSPAAHLVRDAAGNLYGTTPDGGNFSGSCSAFGCGAVFKVDPAGTETVLYTFTGGTDGSAPFAGLIRDPAGNFYGTTSGGGAYGDGVVFKLDPLGQHYKVLYAFTGGADGAYPTGDLIRDASGNLYGTTLLGGNTSGVCSSNFIPGCGVVFKLDPAGTETVLHTFTGEADGALPEAGLIRDAAGNLYGTASEGGEPSSSCFFDAGRCGVVFSLDPAGNETVLHAFTGGADGSLPFAGLIRDPAGNLYGTTAYGGNTSSSCPSGSSGCGVIFKLDPSGNETVVHAFTGGADGYFPVAGLTPGGPAGDLYGTTHLGGNTSSSCPFGSSGCGVVFKVH